MPSGRLQTRSAILPNYKGGEADNLPNAGKGSAVGLVANRNLCYLGSVVAYLREP